MDHSKSNVVQSMNNDKDNEPSTIKQDTGTVEQSTSNVVQSSVNVQQSIDVVNNNSEKCVGIYVEQNIDVVNNNNNDSQPVESLSSCEDHPTRAEVVAMEEAATFTKPALSMEPVQQRTTATSSFRSFCWFWSSCAPSIGLPCVGQRCSVGQIVFFGSFLSWRYGFLFCFQFSSVCTVS